MIEFGRFKGHKLNSEIAEKALNIGNIFSLNIKLFG